jgi:hypothetical protein
MAQVHVLDYTDGRYRCVIHTETPAGNNSAGFPWSTLLLVKGYSGRTILSEGTGPGQITPEEKAEIVAGTILEFEVNIVGSATMTGADLQALLVAEAPAIINAQKARWAQELRFYGGTKA